jgi:hypothetical protein
MHGGKTPRGRAAAGYKHGRYSAHLPERLAARFAESMGDRRLTELRDDLALFDARVGELLENVGKAPAPEWFRSLGKKARAALDRKKVEDAAGFERALIELAEAIVAANVEEQAWAEVYQVMESRRKLVEAVHRRQKDLRHMIEADKAFVLIDRLVDVVARNVKDPVALANIVAEARALTGGMNQPVAQA